MINAIYVLKEHEMFSKSVMNQPNVYHGLFGTHPRNDKRLHDIVAKAVPLQTATTRPPERDFWEMMDGLVFGTVSAFSESAQVGQLHGRVSASARLRSRSRRRCAAPRSCPRSISTRCLSH